MVPKAPPVQHPSPQKRLSRGLALLLGACPLVCVVSAVLTLRGCMHAHSRPVGHGDVTFDVSPDGRILVFNGVGEGGRDLYSFDLESRVVTRLIYSRDYEVCPSFSPDGKHLVFTRGTPGVRADQLCVTNIVTREIYQLTSADENVSNPVVLSDGKSVLCTIETEYRWGGLASSWNESGELRLIDIQTRKQSSFKTPTATVSNLRISKDGRWIAWLADGVYVAPTSDPSKALKVLSQAASVALNADGSLLAISEGNYSPDHKIFLTDRTGKKRRRISGAATGCFDPVFSPDGKYVYFTSESWLDGPNGVSTKTLMKADVARGEVSEVAPYTLFENPSG
ncbi:hypothetical protein EON79_03215 [bacterium]|nr:MAG: hypothetical protein EON79_03215 [bacterium]